MLAGETKHGYEIKKSTASSICRIKRKLLRKEKKYKGDTNRLIKSIRQGRKKYNVANTIRKDYQLNAYEPLKRTWRNPTIYKNQ